MALHPSGRVAPEQMESMIRMLIGVHALALASTPVLFLGAWGLSWRSPNRDRLTLAALVFYTFALLAVMNAAVADGLVTPNIFRQMVASAGAPAAIDGWKMVSRCCSYVNQALADPVCRTILRSAANLASAKSAGLVDIAEPPARCAWARRQLSSVHRRFWLTEPSMAASCFRFQRCACGSRLPGLAAETYLELAASPR